MSRYDQDKGASPDVMSVGKCSHVEYVLLYDGM